jgi:hypothetical protein
MITIGSIFEIPLSDRRFAYGQYVFKDTKMGPIVKIFDLISDTQIQFEQFDVVKPLFPPIITGLFAAIRSGMWKVIGKKAVEGFVYPNFISTFFNEKNGEAGVWFLWDGSKSVRLGTQLPEKYKNLEYLMVWNPPDVVKRIETGEYPFPFRELILENKFIPIVVVKNVD